MVFPGRFSSGCLRCRQRKVKCDEAKPTCKRCYKYGKPCLGYTDEFQFRYSAPNNRPHIIPSSPASEVSATISSAKDEQHRNTPLQTQARAPSRSNQRLLRALERRSCLAIVRHPTESYDNVSVCYFVRRFVTPDDDDGFPGHFSFLPSLYNHLQTGLLETATLSVAQLAAYNYLGRDELRTQSLKNYGRTIRNLQQNIQSLIIAQRTTGLLTQEQDLSGEGLGDPKEHASGLFYLLEKRGPSQIGTKRGAELFLLALLRLIYSFLHEDDTYSDPGAIATVMGLFDPLLRALSLMSKTLSLRHRLCRFMKSGVRLSSTSQGGGEPDEEQVLIQEYFEMLENFHAWDQEAASYWQSTFEGRGVPTTLGEMGSENRHYDAETACIIILIRSARLILLLSMLLYQSTLQPVEEGQGNDYSVLWAESVPLLESDVRKTIDDMLVSVPYALGDVDAKGMPSTMKHDGAAAIIIVHSIRLVTHCTYATASQLQSAEIILNRMNSAIGVRSAVGWMQGEDRLFVLDPPTTASQSITECSPL
ncbi:hypothetical protein F66182_2395 [Fusarium sp. NRRL 66182]|nr:hypothetical protein F66182_2395 [Fusarium sp. NRRL 66182]